MRLDRPSLEQSMKQFSVVVGAICGTPPTRCAHDATIASDGGALLGACCSRDADGDLNCRDGCLRPDALGGQHGWRRAWLVITA